MSEFNFIKKERKIAKEYEELIKKRKDFFQCKENVAEGEIYLEILNEIENICKEEYSYAVDSYPYTKHDPSHCQKVEKYIYDLIPDDRYSRLSCRERFLLISSVWLHDIGMIPNLFQDRDNTKKYLRDIKKPVCVSEIVSDLLDKIQEKDKENALPENKGRFFLKLFPIQEFEKYTEDNDPGCISLPDIHETRQNHSQRSCIYVFNSRRINGRQFVFD